MYTRYIYSIIAGRANSANPVSIMLLIASGKALLSLEHLYSKLFVSEGTKISIQKI